jgi:uncharacterized membrane protein
MQRVVDYIAVGIGIVAALLIIYGVILGAIEVVRAELKGVTTQQGKSEIFEEIRYDIGFHLLLGLEFLIAADIIRTIIRPSLEELAILGGLVAIRTVISYFLGKDIRRKS